jgi:hypothetical protein
MKRKEHYIDILKCSLMNSRNILFKEGGIGFGEKIGK